MSEEKTTVSRPVEPVTVSVVSTGDASRLPSGAVGETEGAHQPNVVVQVIQPLTAIGVRFANTFLTAMLGIVTGGAATNIIPFTDFWDLVLKSCGLALSAASYGLLKDLVTIFGRLEQKNPLLTGNV